MLRSADAVPHAEPLEDRDGGDNRRERLPQFMRENRQKFVFRVVRVFSLAARLPLAFLRLLYVFDLPFHAGLRPYRRFSQRADEQADAPEERDPKTILE